MEDDDGPNPGKVYNSLLLPDISAGRYGRHSVLPMPSSLTDLPADPLITSGQEVGQNLTYGGVKPSWPAKLKNNTGFISDLLGPDEEVGAD